MSSFRFSAGYVYGCTLRMNRRSRSLGEFPLQQKDLYYGENHIKIGSETCYRGRTDRIEVLHAHAMYLFWNITGMRKKTERGGFGDDRQEKKMK